MLFNNNMNNKLRTTVLIITAIILNQIFFCNANSIQVSTVDKSVLLGETVQLNIHSTSLQTSTYWPFVNGTQWGSFCTIAPNKVPSLSSCQIQLPVPRAGIATVQIAKLDRTWCQNEKCLFPVGKSIPAVASENVSNIIEINVNTRKIVGYKNSEKTVCVDWEPWFTPSNLGGKPWLKRSEGVPILGLYSSFNANVVRQHAIWFAEAGINCILVDWSNNLWGNVSWEDRHSDIQELINATTFALNEYEAMRKEGLIATPQVVIMNGLLNGPISTAASPKALETQAAWIYTNYILKFGIENFLVINGKPVLVMLDTGTTTIPNINWNISTSFTIRWMGTQLQNNPLLGLKEGFWSWMDGTYEPIPAMVPTVKNDNDTNKKKLEVEALTVTPAFFTHGGWLDSAAAPYNNGATFVKTMESAVKLQPKILLICQWNEFAGQPGGPPGVFVDSYNATLTNGM